MITGGVSFTKSDIAKVRLRVGLREEIVLTRREVKDAALPGYAFFVCSGIEPRRADGVVRAAGSICRVRRTWDVIRHRMTPLALEVTLDCSAGDDVDVAPVGDE